MLVFKTTIKRYMFEIEQLPERQLNKSVRWIPSFFLLMPDLLSSIPENMVINGCDAAKAFRYAIY